MDSDLGAMTGKLPAETMNIDLNGIRRDVAVRSENVVFDQLFRDDAALMPHQEFQHRRFAGEQDLWYVVDEDLAAFGVEREIADLKRALE